MDATKWLKKNPLKSCVLLKARISKTRCDETRVLSAICSDCTLGIPSSKTLVEVAVEEFLLTFHLFWECTIPHEWLAVRLQSTTSDYMKRFVEFREILKSKGFTNLRDTSSGHKFTMKYKKHRNLWDKSANKRRPRPPIPELY